MNKIKRINKVTPKKRSSRKRLLTIKCSLKNLKKYVFDLSFYYCIFSRY